MFLTHWVLINLYDFFEREKKFVGSLALNLTKTNFGNSLSVTNWWHKSEAALCKMVFTYSTRIQCGRINHIYPVGSLAILAIQAYRRLCDLKFGAFNALRQQNSTF